MLTIGLTGQSGAGKGEVSRIFTELCGVVCLDTDKTAREVVEKGKPALNELCEYFGGDILDIDGSLNRKKLASVAFSDEEKHKKLNEITHFYIINEIKKWLDDVKKDGVKIAIIDAPLLFESGADKLCDVIIGVIAPYEKRLRRIMSRDSIDEKNARLRLDSQPSDDFFTKKCSYIITNNSDFDSLKQNTLAILEKILSK